MLYLVPTPIGNLGDMTPRAIDTLKEADLILAEDTRTSGRLLKHFEIDTQMTPYHAHNEHKVVERFIRLQQEGKTLALISDAGTPAISDPGFLLVRACHEHGLTVSCLPGANALTPALAVSGIPSTHFYFEGFLPHKKGRQTRWKFLATLDCTIALYESTHRIGKLVDEVCTYLGEERTICVIKEISKLHETIFRGTAADVKEQLKSKNTKGEFVVIISNS